MPFYFPQQYIPLPGLIPVFYQFSSDTVSEDYIFPDWITSSYFYQGLLPQWIDLEHTINPNSGSLIGRFLTTSLQDWSIWHNEVYQVVSQWSTIPSVSENWRMWACQSLDTPAEEVVVHTSLGDIVPTKTMSLWEFLNNPGAVWVNHLGTIRFRNLAQRSTERDVAGSYTFLQTLLPGEDVLYNGVKAKLSGSTATVPVTGSVIFHYHDQDWFDSLLEATVTVDNAPTVPLRFEPLWNNWDELSLPLGLNRLTYEDNISLASRIYLSKWRGSTRDLVRRSLSLDIGRTSLDLWDSSSDYNKSSYTDSWLLNEPQFYSNLESLREVDGIWYAPISGWNSDAVVFVNSQVHDYQTDGEGVSLQVDHDNLDVRARVRVERYTVDEESIFSNTLPNATYRIANVSGVSTEHAVKESLEVQEQISNFGPKFFLGSMCWGQRWSSDGLSSYIPAYTDS